MENVEEKQKQQHQYERLVVKFDANWYEWTTKNPNKKNNFYNNQNIITNKWNKNIFCVFCKWTQFPVVVFFFLVMLLLLS